MYSIEEYIDSRLKRLSGSFKIYKNKDGGFLHLYEKFNSNVDLDFWELVKTVNVKNKNK